MVAARAIITRYRSLALLLAIMALCLKVVLPSGYMIGVHSRILTIQMCEEGAGASLSRQIVLPMNGDADDRGTGRGKVDCPYAVLSMASSAGVQLTLLAVASIFFLPPFLRPASQDAMPSRAHLRPPLRGPPARF